MTTESISQIPNLEPMFGIVLAINLAYIALERFRYREQIRTFSKEKLNDVTDPSQAVKMLEWYQSVSRLTTIPNNSINDEYKKAKLPDTTWAKRYHRWYETHNDMKIAATIATTAALLVSIGCAHSFGYLLGLWNIKLPWIFAGKGIHTLFWLTILGMAWPPFCVVRGRKVVDEACVWADKTVRDGIATMQAVAQSARAPKTGNKKSTGNK